MKFCVSVLVACAIALAATEAAAVPITFAEDELTVIYTDALVPEMQSIAVVSFTDLGDPSADEFSFEMSIEGTFQNYRSGIAFTHEDENGIWEQERHSFFRYHSLSVRTSSAIVQTFDVIDWSGLPSVTAGVVGSREGFSSNSPPEQGITLPYFDDFVLAWNWRATYVMTARADEREGVLSISLHPGRDTYDCVWLNGGFEWCEGDGWVVEDGASAFIAYTTPVPEPSTALLVGIGLAVLRARRRST